MTDQQRFCAKCGHSSSYHGMSFCHLSIGENPGPVKCDCDGWSESLGHLAARGFQNQPFTLLDVPCTNCGAEIGGSCDGKPDNSVCVQRGMGWVS